MWNRVKNWFKREKRNFSLVVIGLDQSGKTTTIKFLKYGSEEAQQTIPTTGAMFYTVPIGPNIRFSVTDLGGQKDYRRFWDGPITDTDALIFVLDILDTARYEEARTEFYNAIEKLRKNNRNGFKTPILLLLNKIDLVSDDELSAKKQEIMNFFDLEGLTASQNPWQIQLTSALQGEGLPEMMVWLYEILTGKKGDMDNIYKEFLVFDHSGIPLISKAQTLGENTIAAGFLAAINGYVTTIQSKKLDDFTMGDLKVIFQNVGELIGAIVVNIDSDIIKAKSILEDLMTKINQVEFQGLNQDDLKKFYSETIINQLSSK